MHTQTKLIALAALVATPILAGCASGPGYETHDVDEWKRLYEDTPGAFLLDVRTPAEFAQGHIEGATLVPVDEVKSRASELPADKSTPLFVYCRSGNRSATASAVLADLGYTDVHNLAGGILDWTAAGHPIVA